MSSVPRGVGRGPENDVVVAQNHHNFRNPWLVKGRSFAHFVFETAHRHPTPEVMGLTFGDRHGWTGTLEGVGSGPLTQHD